MSLLAKIQEDIQKELLSYDWFKNVPTVTDDKGDVATEVNQKILELGLVVVIEIEKIEVEFQNVGSTAIRLPIVFTVIESVLLNRDELKGTGKTAKDVIEHLFAVFNPVRATEENHKLPCTLESADLINDVGGKLIYQVLGTVQAGWKLSPET